MPSSNAFLIINLGCEMLYVIDQRLRAQSISLEKSAQVLRDLTRVLFDEKLIVQLINPHPCQHILTVQQCRILLTDIACCSLMRLDITSMDKLWDLMIMLFKWQLHMIRDSPSRLLELTFRHMDGVSKLMPEMRKTLLVDSTKRCLIEFWDTLTQDEIVELSAKLLHWTHPFNVKISILIRTGFQRNDGSFESTPSHMCMEHFKDYMDNIGENVYAKSANAANAKSQRKLSNAKDGNSRKSTISNELNSLASQLNINNDFLPNEQPSDEPVPDEPIEKETNSQSSGSNDLIDDVQCSMTTDSPKNDSDQSTSEFIHLKKTTTALQGYLEQFQLEHIQTGDGENGKSFDATEELLKMLENNEKQ